MLPQSIRERVYEPAYLDLWRAHVLGTEAQPTRGTRAFSGMTIAAYLRAALWYAFPIYDPFAQRYRRRERGLELLARFRRL